MSFVFYQCRPYLLRMLFLNSSVFLTEHCFHIFKRDLIINAQRHALLSRYNYFFSPNRCSTVVHNIPKIIFNHLRYKRNKCIDFSNSSLQRICYHIEQLTQAYSFSPWISQRVLTTGFESLTFSIVDD